MVIHHHKIDMIPGGVPTVVHVSQYDEDFRIEFQLYWSGGHARSYNSTPTAKVYGTKLDGNGYSADCTVTGGSPLVVIVEGDEQMTAIAGKNIFELALFDPTSGRKVHSSNFILQVEPAALDGNTIVSESVVDDITNFLEYHPEYYDDAVDDVVIVDDIQPTTRRNKLWVHKTPLDGVKIPTMEDIRGLEEIFTGNVDESVQNWLDVHPEATSTVEPNSITQSKINSGFLPSIMNDFVTPQMYGAVANGVADDTEAIQAAVDSGKDVYIPAGTYKTTETINITFRTNLCFNASGSTINYTGTDYAFLIRGMQYSTLYFGEINAANGGCIKIYTARINNQGEYKYDYVQYTDIHFNILSASTDCVFFNATERGWLNEIRLFGGRLTSGENGVRYLHNSANGTSHNAFCNIGIEGVTKGFNFIVDSVAEAANKSFIDFEFYNLRTAETDNIFTTVGRCTRFLIVGAYTANASKMNLSAESDNWLVVTPAQFQIINNGTIKTIDQNEALRWLNWTEITNGADLNSYTTPGRYTARTAAIAQSLSNSPVTTAFNMEVTAIANVYGSNNRYQYIIQEIQALNNTGTFYRRHLNTGDYGVNWTVHPWYVFQGVQVGT